MPPPTNFKSQETTSRLLAAFFASLEQPVRIDYKRTDWGGERNVQALKDSEVARYFGSGVSESAMEHRFRPIRVQAEVLRGLADGGQDPGAYDVLACKTRDEMQKLFGASTADGIAFQFRSVKQGAKTLQDAVDNGKDPVAAFSAMHGGSGASASVPSTPSAGRTASTPGSTKRARSTTKKAASGGVTPTSKRRKAIKIEEIDDEDSPDVDYSELDTTPTKAPKELETTNPAGLLPRSAWVRPPPGQPRRMSQLMTAELAAMRAQTEARAAASAPTTAAPAPSPGMGHNQVQPNTNDLLSPSYPAGPVHSNTVTAVSVHQSHNQYYQPPPAPRSSSILDSASPSGASASEVNTPQTAASYASATTLSQGGSSASYTAAPPYNAGISFKTESDTTASFADSQSMTTHNPYMSFVNDDTYPSHVGGYGGYQNGYGQEDDDEHWDAGDV